MQTTHIFESNRRKAFAGIGVAAAGAALIASTLGGNTPPNGSASHSKTSAHRAPTPDRFERPQVGALARADTPPWTRRMGVAGVPSEVGVAFERLALASGTVDDPGRSTTDDRSTPAPDAPHKVTLTLPQYHSGTSPSVTPPSVSGSPPSVRNDDGAITLTIPNDGEVTPPRYEPGESGHLDPPSVTVE
jgi:hypothetical protein